MGKLNMKTFTKQWLQKAEEDILAATSLLDAEIRVHAVICFHFQQAAEKYIKGLLSEFDIEFIKTHDLSRLLDLFIEKGWKVTDDCMNSALLLSEYGVLPRYPGDYAEITKNESLSAQFAFSENKTWALSILYKQ
jgi:HEPN domain-containing protein